MDALTKSDSGTPQPKTGNSGTKRPKVLVLGEMTGGHLEAWIHPLKTQFELHVVTMHDCGAREAGITYHPSIPPVVGRLTYLPWFFLVQLITWRVRPDIVYISYLSSYGLAPVFVSFKCPIVLSVWGTDVNSLTTGRPIVRYLAKKSLRKYSRINVPALHMLEKMVESLDFRDRSKVEVFQYGVDAGEDIDQKAAGHTIKIASIRNWAPWYRVREVVAGFSQMIKQGRVPANVQLHLFGGGNAKDSDDVLKLIAAAELGSQITVHGNLDKAEFYRDLADCDFFVSVPDRDGLSLAVLEACARGCFPILSNIDANTEWFSDQDAVFADAGDVSGIANAMQRACAMISEQPDAIARGRKRNRVKVVREADYTTNTRRLADLLLVAAR